MIVDKYFVLELIKIIKHVNKTKHALLSLKTSLLRQDDESFVNVAMIRVITVYLSIPTCITT